MLKHVALILSLLALQTPLNAQNLVESGQTLPGLWAGSAAWGDYDADGDQDLALMGEMAEDGQCMRIVRIYGNNEALLFEDQAPSEQLIGAYYGDLAWADYDNDGDLDLAVVGWDVENNESLRLYLNDASSGERVLALDRLQLDNAGEASLQGVRYASLAWADYDSDGDPDLVVSGMGANGTSLTLLYQNDRGVLQIDDINSETLVNLHNGNLAWGDYDNDGDLDLAVSGENVTTTGGLGAVTEFYLNDPTGTLGLDRTIIAGAQVKGG
ncbi:MAG: VCBS repeat-containing protein, partial [Candidatus Latescibacteria bacterium]|nr:VCBS repeat-containing protein [Candidatus Latescibacterota bacterium]